MNIQNESLTRTIEKLDGLGWTVWGIGVEPGQAAAQATLRVTIPYRDTPAVENQANG